MGYISVSRGGWITPVALRKIEGEALFWVSISGAAAQENYPYLIYEHLSLQGKPAAYCAMIVSEWLAHVTLTRDTSATYEEYIAATRHLHRDSLMIRLSGGEGGLPTRADFREAQQGPHAMHHDSVTGNIIRVPNFEAVLSGIDAPVMGVFGRLDRNVNWRATKALYERSIGANPEAELRIEVIDGVNHGMRAAETGSMFEPMAERATPRLGELLHDYLSALGYPPAAAE
jgi:hypothetical protein